MNFFVFITLFLLLITGCTQQNSGSTTTIITPESKGVSIINFTSSFYNMRINEATNIKVTLKNNGFFEATNIKSILYGEGLLERSNEINYIESLLPDKEAFHFWTLKVPLTLSKTETTFYTIGARLYYNYNYSGTQQVAFVSPDYTGGDIALSSVNRKSPVSTTINVRNPVRTLPAEDDDDRTIFTVTIILTDNDLGKVDYYNCSALSTPPCRKAGYLNSLEIQTPNDWEPITNLETWNQEEVESTNEIIYSINYDELEIAYDAPVDIKGVVCPDYNTCIATGEKSAICSDTSVCTGYTSCKSQSTTRCNLISEAINNLRMIRDEEARVILQFSKPLVSEVLIDTITVRGSFGYEIDVSSFTNRATIQILGD